MTAQPLGPALDDAGHPLDQVVLTGISAFGYHGVFEHERREGQTFVADVVVHLDTRRAAATDDLTRTVHYGDLAEQVAAVLGGDPADLVETVAERIAATALAHPAVAAVDVTVHKPGAPITVPFADVAVRVRRDRQKLPAAEPWVPTSAGHAAGDAGRGGPASAPSAPTGRHGVAPAAAASVAPAGEPDRLDEVPPVAVDAVLALGSNLGAPQSTLRAAVADIGELEGVEVVAVSPLARTAPVGGPSQPDFLNAVVLVRTTLSARGLLRAAQSVEARHGRERDERWGPRTLDVDLITYDSTLAVTDDLELPHPRAHQRAFVLQPWAQVAPDAVLPGLGGGPVAALAATAPDRDGVRWLALDWMTAPAHREHVPEPSPADAAPAGAVPVDAEPANAEPANAVPANAVPASAEPPNAEPAHAERPPAGAALLGAVHDDAVVGVVDDDVLGDAVEPAPRAPHHAEASEPPAPPVPVAGGAHRLEPLAEHASPDDPLGWLPDPPAHRSPVADAEQRRTIFSPVVPPSGEVPRAEVQGP